MKPILLISALLMGTQMLSAQAVSTTVTVSGEDTVSVTTTTNNTHVYNSLVSRTDDGEGNHTWNINLFGVNSKYPFEPVRIHHNWDVDFEINRAYIGWSELSTKDFDLRPANSLEFGFEFLRTKAWNRSHTVGFETGLGVSWTRYALRDDKVLYNDASGRTICAKYDKPDLDGRDYSRSRMTYASWRLPMVLKLRSFGGSQQFTIGAEAELRHHLRSRIKAGKSKKFYAEGHDLAVNPMSCNLLLSYSNSAFTVFGRYGLTEFFDQDKTNLSAHPFMIGLSFGL